MTRHEKIEFIKKSRFYGYAYMNLEDVDEQELNEIVYNILTRLQMEEISINGNKLREFTIYLN
jgi:hypothetical protein